MKPNDIVTLITIKHAQPTDLRLIDSIEGDMAKCCTMGGGFIYKIPLAHLRLATPEEMSPPFRETFFSGDWLADRDGKNTAWFKGITDGTVWNGWANPWFTKEEAMRLIAFNPVEGGSRIEYDEAKDEFAEIYEGERQPCQILDHNGVRYHGIGNGGWCWDEWNPRRKEDIDGVLKQFPDYKP